VTGSPEPITFERDGLQLSALDWGGDAPPLVLLHPNGFCAGFFEPLARRLAGEFRCVGVDLRGHGRSQAPATTKGLAFAAMAADVVVCLEALGLDKVDVVGQSLGGGVGVLVDALRPGLVRHLLLFEAVAFPMTRPPDGPNTMADAARRRRAVWPDRDAMRESYANKPPLSELADDFLDAYLQWGVRDRPDGQVELACSPATEATVFAMSPTDRGAPAAWAHLPHLEAEASVVAGNRSFLPTEFFTGQAAQAAAPFHRVAGGHFMIQEDAHRSAELVIRLLAR